MTRYFCFRDPGCIMVKYNEFTHALYLQLVFTLCAALPLPNKPIWISVIGTLIAVCL